jgi:hypothetical protein
MAKLAFTARTMWASKVWKDRTGDQQLEYMQYIFGSVRSMFTNQKRSSLFFNLLKASASRGFAMYQRLKTQERLFAEELEDLEEEDDDDSIRKYYNKDFLNRRIKFIIGNYNSAVDLLTKHTSDSLVPSLAVEVTQQRNKLSKLRAEVKAAKKRAAVWEQRKKDASKAEKETREKKLKYIAFVDGKVAEYKNCRGVSFAFYACLFAFNFNINICLYSVWAMSGCGRW